MHRFTVVDGQQLVFVGAPPLVVREAGEDVLVLDLGAQTLGVEEKRSRRRTREDVAMVRVDDGQRLGRRAARIRERARGRGEGHNPFVDRERVGAADVAKCTRRQLGQAPPYGRRRAAGVRRVFVVLREADLLAGVVVTRPDHRRDDAEHDDHRDGGTGGDEHDAPDVAGTRRGLGLGIGRRPFDRRPVVREEVVRLEVAVGAVGVVRPALPGHISL